MLTIQPLKEASLSKFNQADTSFLAGERVQLRVTRKGFLTEYVPLPVAVWRCVAPFPAEPKLLMENPKVACYIAFVDGQYAGQCVIGEGKHQLCELLDFRTDSHFRRQGIANQLLNACEDWAQRRKFAGLRTEVSDEQPAACQFLEHVGFTLGGVDRLWHFADPEQQKQVPAMRESVLVFYKFFKAEAWL